MKCRINEVFTKNILFIYFLEGGKQQCVVAPPTPPTGDLACNPGMCPGWECNQLPFGSQAQAQSTELHQPGFNYSFKVTRF